jgi:hypothetical protein
MSDTWSSVMNSFRIEKGLSGYTTVTGMDLFRSSQPDKAPLFYIVQQPKKSILVYDK